jgi:hypothetical protein
MGGYLAQGTYASGVPANKVAASGSGIATLSATAGNTIEKAILTETVKINNPTDLIISATAECAILTQVTNSAGPSGSDPVSRATGQVVMYIKIDGKVVPVSSDDTTDPQTGAKKGEVVFCNRVQEQQWTDSNDPTKGNDDSGDKIRQYLNTRDANGFNWLALNVGTNYPSLTSDNVHTIELWARWTATTAGQAVAEAKGGKRTLVLEPVKAWNREAVELA